MEFSDVKVGDKIINRENPTGIYIVGSKSEDLIAVSDANNYKDCFHLTKTGIRKYHLVSEKKRKVIIKAVTGMTFTSSWCFAESSATCCQ